MKPFAGKQIVLVGEFLQLRPVPNRFDEEEDLSTYRQRKLEPESVEAICLDVMDFRNCCFSVCACYRSEIVNKPAEFRSLLNTTWTCLLTKMKEEWKTRHSKICRNTEKSKSLIDVILAGHPERFTTCGNLHLGVSGHDLSGNKIPRRKACEIEYRSIKNLDENELLQELRQRGLEVTNYRGLLPNYNKISR
ncbi:hypothetical protein P5673_023207 [Acropora cervicornis]|uniref:DNA helicase n=1 Tax=Acropora cervicornis TaxID=6130 RepID=A0AAD9UZA2_ACRCE|nr:hypothetical protein P5673_023207 [Acropora cervicornis]